ncbi:MAG: c-type cytochrome [Chromatiales bacterium]|nr:c-type cytochrome [Chromatiales bacterium]
MAVFFSLALAGAIATTPVMAQEPATAGDPARGQVLSDTCMGCHGIPGYRNAYPSYRVPKLGGQTADYIVLALQGYRNQTRPHKTMHAQAVSLSDQDMQDIAAFFVSEGAIQKASATVGTAPEKAATCVACHGEGGVSVAANWPSLAGQHKDYLVHALNEYKGGLRKDPVMGSMAAPLTAQDIQELATYFASQSGLFSVHYAVGPKTARNTATAE